MLDALDTSCIVAREVNDGYIHILKIDIGEELWVSFQDVSWLKHSALRSAILTENGRIFHHIGDDD